jgi:hypothetical protein
MVIFITLLAGFVPLLQVTFFTLLEDFYPDRLAVKDRDKTTRITGVILIKTLTQSPPPRSHRHHSTMLRVSLVLLVSSDLHEHLSLELAQLSDLILPRFLHQNIAFA